MPCLFIAFLNKVLSLKRGTVTTLLKKASLDPAVLANHETITKLTTDANMLDKLVIHLQLHMEEFDL